MQLDAIIIGTGQAGPSLAGRMTDGGMKVAVVERALFGGTCVNTGCTPTKTLIASAAVPPLPGVDQVPHLDNSSILALDQLPEHLIVVGGSYVGLEFAQMYRRFGAEVTVVEMRPHLIPREDAEVSIAVEGILSAEGIALRTGAKCISLAPHERGVAVSVRHPKARG